VSGSDVSDSKIVELADSCDSISNLVASLSELMISSSFNQNDGLEAARNVLQCLACLQFCRF